MLTTVSKMRGQVNSPGYPQPEGLLGECMTKYGWDLGKESNFGKSFEASHSGGHRLGQMWCMLFYYQCGLTR